MKYKTTLMLLPGTIGKMDVTHITDIPSQYSGDRLIIYFDDGKTKRFYETRHILFADFSQIEVTK